MAGGDRTNDYGTMAQRVAASHSTPNTARSPALSVVERREQADYRTTEPCHVWVLTEAGRVPGLLLEWRKPVECPWEGRVHLVRPMGGDWSQLVQWLPAGAIERRE